MRKELKKYGRREPFYPLTFWKKSNTQTSFVSPRTFNIITRAALSSQASSESVECVFSNLERLEGRQRQSTLSSTLEMQKTIRVFVHMNQRSNILPRTGRTHQKAAAFKRLATQIATEVVKMK